MISLRNNRIWGRVHGASAAMSKYPMKPSSLTDFFSNDSATLFDPYEYCQFPEATHLYNSTCSPFLPYVPSSLAKGAINAPSLAREGVEMEYSDTEPQVLPGVDTFSQVGDPPPFSGRDINIAADERLDITTTNPWTSNVEKTNCDLSPLTLKAYSPTNSQFVEMLMGEQSDDCQDRGPINDVVTLSRTADEFESQNCSHIDAAEESDGQRRHLKSVSICSKCGEKFSTLQQKKKHIRTVHESGKFPCPECGLFLKSLENLRRHCMCHSDPSSTMACPHCGGRFSSPRGLTLHVKRVHKPRSERIIRGKNFVVSSVGECRRWEDEDWDQKTKSVRFKGAIKCWKCPRTFATKQSCVRHVRIVHDKVRPFQCKSCSKAFSTKHNYNLHHYKEHLKK